MPKLPKNMPKLGKKQPNCKISAKIDQKWPQENLQTWPKKAKIGQNLANKYAQIGQISAQIGQKNARICQIAQNQAING